MAGRKDPKPDWVTPEVEAMQRAAWRRQRRIARTLLPCPKCGCAPEVDTGLLDAPFPPGQEMIWCPRYFDGPDIPLQSCGVHSIGAAAWNWRYRPDGGA